MKTRDNVFTTAEFKANFLKILDELGPSGVIITKRGHAIAKVIPIASPDNTKLIGCMKGKITIKGDTFSTGRKWKAHS